MDKPNTNRALLTGLLFAVAVIAHATYQNGRTSQLRDMREVYTICHTAGKQCQQAQVSTSTEYLCNTNGNCWVEVK